MKNCTHLVPTNRRIVLYEPGNESVINGAYATLAEAMKDYKIPENIEFEQGLGALFIAVPYLSRKRA